jgi:hypothetical protein
MESGSAVLSTTTVILGLLAGTASAAVIVVDPSGEGDYTHPSNAVWAAEDGDTIQVLPGTYTGSSSAVVWVPDKLVHITGIGDAADIVIDGEGERYGVQFDTSDAASSISNLTITNTLGAGVRIYNSKPEVDNCLLTACSGSAIVAVSTADAVISNCDIWNNSGEAGAAIWTAATFLQIIGCNIHHNTASNGAAVHHNSAGGTLQISGCDIHDNVGTYGGGVYSRARTLEIVNTTIRENVTDYGGSGVYLEYAETATVTDCDISWNSGPSLTVDAVTFKTCSSVAITNTVIHANSSNGISTYDSPSQIAGCTVSAHDTTGSGWGGAIHHKGAAHTITGTTIAGNVADNGPAIHADYNTSIAVDGCTIVNNTSAYGYEWTAAVTAWLSDGESVSISNSDLCNNTPADLDDAWIAGDAGTNTFEAFCTWCPGDIDGSLQTGLSDIFWLIERWACTDCAGDYDGNGEIGVGDILHVLDDWGCQITDPL